MTAPAARLTDLPVSVIGVGPVALAAAADLVERGPTPMLLDRGRSVGASLLAWSHVRTFPPWAYNINAAGGSPIEEQGRTAPDPGELQPEQGYPAFDPASVTQRASHIAAAGLPQQSALLGSVLDVVQTSVPGSTTRTLRAVA